jgi:hypothetical protein
MLASRNAGKMTINNGGQAAKRWAVGVLLSAEWEIEMGAFREGRGG